MPKKRHKKLWGEKFSPEANALRQLLDELATERAKRDQGGARLKAADPIEEAREDRTGSPTDASQQRTAEDAEGKAEDSPQRGR